LIAGQTVTRSTASHHGIAHRRVSAEGELIRSAGLGFQIREDRGWHLRPSTGQEVGDSDELNAGVSVDAFGAP
jgi:hypothetical protein